jgi:radical SAM protein with 4Fe4S-binding SPASM domain
MKHQQVEGFNLPFAQWRSMVADIKPEQHVFQDQLFDVVLQQSDGRAQEGLEVNFHQKPFDQPDRYWRFILNQGDFFEYLLNRLYWYLAPKNGVVTRFPLHVDIETANTCNMNCPMCYRDRIKEIGRMEFDLFCKAIDECAGENVYSIRLSWRGEPLTHPRIKEMIAYATKRIANVSFLTNAFYLTEEIIDCLVTHQVNYVAVSFDGIGSVYESIRHPAKYVESREKLADLQRYRNHANSTRPQVRLCTVWPAIKEDPQAYADAMRPVSDYMVYNPYINFNGPMTLKPDFICQYPWERMMVAWNGNVQCCTGWNAGDIVLGNLADTTIKDLWHNPRMDEIRALHREGRRMDLESCAKCRHGSTSDPNVEIEDIIARNF